MKKRTVHILSVVLAAFIILLMIAYASVRNNPQLDRFLDQRRALLAMLDANTKDLPIGFQYVLSPNAPRYPGNDHIRSVVGNSEPWFGDNFSSYDLRIVGPRRDALPREVVTELFGHLASGLEDLGFVSPKSGGPDWLVEDRRAAHTTWWYNSDRRLLVTISVVVDMESCSAHITRYVHERFD